MTKEETKDLLVQIFGRTAAEDDDIVDWYYRVNNLAIEEHAKDQAIEFATFLYDYGVHRNRGLYVGEEMVAYEEEKEVLYNFFLASKK